MSVTNVLSRCAGILLIVLIAASNAAAAKRTVYAVGPSEAVIEGVLLRLRPIVMTYAASIADLSPILCGHGTGSEAMPRIAAPMWAAW